MTTRTRMENEKVDRKRLTGPSMNRAAHLYPKAKMPIYKKHCRLTNPSKHSRHCKTRTLVSFPGGDRFVPTRGTFPKSLAVRQSNDVSSSNVVTPTLENKPQKDIVEHEYRCFMASTLYDLPHESVDENGAPNRIFNFSGRASSNIALSFRYSSKMQSMTRMCSYLDFDTVDRSTKLHRRKLPDRAFRILDAPGLIDDFYTNNVCWNKDNFLAVGLKDKAYLWHSQHGVKDGCILTESENEVVTSISFCSELPNILAVGADSGDVFLVDTVGNRYICRLSGHTGHMVTSLTWNGPMLTTGDRSGKILNHDVRLKKSVVANLSGAHKRSICSLKWDGNGQYLASGSNCNSVCIWDLSMHGNNSGHPNPVTNFYEHQAAVKAIDWCPYRRGVIATGGGSADPTIHVWNCHTGKIHNSVNTRSQVTGLHWSRRIDGDLLSTHGFGAESMNLWNVSRGRTSELVKSFNEQGDRRILHLAVSPNEEQMVVAAGTDEKLCFWDIFARCGTKSNNYGLSGNPTFGVPQIR